MLKNIVFLPNITVFAGFPSPAKDYVEKIMDLNDHLIFNPLATYLMRVTGWSMKEAGIFDGDEIIIDRSLPPINGNVVVAVVNGGFVVKRLKDEEGSFKLVSDNVGFEDLVFTEEDFPDVWGVVTRVLHKV